MVPLRLLSLREKDPERWKLAMNLVSHFDEHESHNNDKVEYILATSMPILENCGVSREDIRLISHLMGILWYVITFLFYLPRGPNCKLVKLSDKNTNEKVSIFKKWLDAVSDFQTLCT